MDWEVEMVVVIGKPCRNLKPENTMENVFGYTVAQVCPCLLNFKSQIKLFYSAF